MSGSLRRLAHQTARSLFLSDSTALPQQSRRWLGDLPVKANKNIENWGTFREHVEDTFTFNAATLSRVAVWAVGFPVFLYTVMTAEFNTADVKAGRKTRDFM